MTLIVRRLGEPTWSRLGSAGWCRVGLTEIVGVWGHGPLKRILFLGAM